MASPRIVGFALFDGSGNPLAGQAPTFATYKNEAGANLTQPSIVEIGGGLYFFTPTLDPAHCIAYMIDGGMSANPRYNFDVIRPEQFDVDLIHPALKVLTNRWKIAANQLVIYDNDGTTVLYTFNLFDATHTPTMSQIFERVPV